MIYAAYVDPVTWRDRGRFEIMGGSVEAEPGTVSATIDTTEIMTESWVRLWDDSVPVFTGLATSPGQNLKGGLVTTKLECYSVLKPVDDILLPRGWYAPAANAGKILKQLLKTPAPVEIETTPALETAIIAEESETNLSMVQKILEAINFRIRILGNGTIQILPKAVAESVTVSPTNDVIEPEITIEHDLFDVPNIIRAVSDDVVAIARDDSDGPLSVSGRGREIWREEDVDLAGESIAEAAQRLLKESQCSAKKIKYKRMYDPNILVGDRIRFSYAEIQGLYEITSQSTELGGNTTEEAIWIS